ncbi:uncharacterized protein EI97DRAFT_388266, partial [Westerdykella ornata]
QIYIYTNQLASRGVRGMQRRNIVLTKEGARVGVREMDGEEYADWTQRALVNTWNAAYTDVKGKGKGKGNGKATATT